MNKGTVLQILLAVLAGVSVASVTQAAVLFTEMFSYPDGHLASSPPAGGVSGGLWSVHEAGVEQLRVDVSSGKIILFQNSRTICGTCVTSHGQDVHRDFSTLSAGQTAFAGFDVSAMGNDDPVYFAEFMGGPTKLFVTPFAGSNFTFGIGNESDTSVPTANWPSGLTFDTTYRVVVSYEFDTGISRLWVNPINESSTNVQVTGLSSVPVSALALRQYWIGTVVVPSRQVIDNITVGTTFDDVLAIPGPALLGDFNGDDAVDAADYVVWRTTDGGPAGYNLWQSNFGESTGSGSGAIANVTVPEPTSLVLVMFAVAGWFLRRGRAAGKVPSSRCRVVLVN